MASPRTGAETTALGPRPRPGHPRRTLKASGELHVALYDERTTCVLCGQPLGSREVIAFPPFVRNRRDPLAILHDAAVHAACLRRHPRADAALAARSRAVLETPACVVCDRPIGSGEPAFRAGLLSSDEESALHRFDFVCLHPDCYKRWTDARDFELAVNEAMRSSDWEGPVIRFVPHPVWTAEVSETGEPGAKQRVVWRSGPKGRAS